MTEFGVYSMLGGRLDGMQRSRTGGRGEGKGGFFKAGTWTEETETETGELCAHVKRDDRRTNMAARKLRSAVAKCDHGELEQEGIPGNTAPCHAATN